MVNLPGLTAPGVAGGGLGGPQVWAGPHVVTALLTGQQDDVRGLARAWHAGSDADPGTEIRRNIFAKVEL